MTVDEVYRYIDVTPFGRRPAVFWGTNITPEHVVDDFAKGMGTDAILKAHPQLSADHIEAAFTYVREFPSDPERLLIALRFFT